MVFKVEKRDQDLYAEPAGQGDRDAIEVVLFDEIIERDTEFLEDDAEVVSIVEVVDHFDDVLPVFWVVVVHVLDEADLDEPLLFEFFFVADDFHGDDVVVLVVSALQDDSESAHAEHLHDLISEKHMVEFLVVVLSVFIVVAIIFFAGRRLKPSFSLEYIQIVDCVDLVELFEFCREEKVDEFEFGLLRRHGEFIFFLFGLACLGRRGWFGVNGEERVSFLRLESRFDFDLLRRAARVLILEGYERLF